jgi:hypothetical protein
LRREISTVISGAIALKVHHGRISPMVRNFCTIARRIAAGMPVIDR